MKLPPLNKPQGTGRGCADGKIMGLSESSACRPRQVKLSCFPPRKNRILKGFTSLAGTSYLVEVVGMCLIDSSIVRGVERALGRRAKFLKGEASLDVSYPRKCALSYLRRWSLIQKVLPSQLFADLPLHK